MRIFVKFSVSSFFLSPNNMHYILTLYKAGNDFYQYSMGRTKKLSVHPLECVVLHIASYKIWMLHGLYDDPQAWRPYNGFSLHIHEQSELLTFACLILCVHSTVKHTFMRLHYPYGNFSIKIKNEKILKKCRMLPLNQHCSESKSPNLYFLPILYTISRIISHVNLNGGKMF